MSDLRVFFKEFLEMEGAVTEDIDPVGLEVIAPETLQKSLEVPEFFSLGFTAELPPAAQPVTLESEWMEQISHTMGRQGEQLRVIQNPEFSPPSKPERLLEHLLLFDNATYRFSKISSAWTRYWILKFKYTAVSDEKKEGILELGINLNNGGLLLENLITKVLDNAENKHIFLPRDGLPKDAILPETWETEKLKLRLENILPEMARHHLNSFLNSMQQRQERDLVRILDYHLSLRDDSIHYLATLEKKKTLSERQKSEQKRHQMRLESIQREYLAKAKDVQQKFEIQIECKIEQVLELILPIQRFEIQILRRKGKRMLSLDWNPLTRKLDFPPCEFGFQADFHRLVCDEKLHLVSLTGIAPCLKCEKTFCRACHPYQCPKCNARVLA